MEPILGLPSFKKITRYYKSISLNLKVLLLRQKRHAADAASIQAANADLVASKAALEKDRNNLTKKLGRHELDILAAAKPGLVVKIINRASKNELRCFEIQSGSPLTHDELAARKKSEINGECPGIANPNFGVEES